MNGFFLVNKKADETSHDVVNQVKRKFNLKKVGHTGTLDPFATGLLIVLVGNATKLAYLFANLDKDYSGIMIFGTKYNTYDTTGNPIDEKPTNFSDEDVLKAFINFQKSYMQIPPVFSAIKIKGKKAYELARAGKDVKINERKVDVKSLVKTSLYLHNEVSFYTSVSKGTYIRSLAYDIGEYLGTYGALKTLKREKIGIYDIKDAKTVAKLTSDDLIEDLSLFDSINIIKINDFEAKLVKNGIWLDERHIKTKKPFLVEYKNNIIAYYEPSDKLYHYQPKYFFEVKHEDL